MARRAENELFVSEELERQYTHITSAVHALRTDRGNAALYRATIQHADKFAEAWEDLAPEEGEKMDPAVRSQMRSLEELALRAAALVKKAAIIARERANDPLIPFSNRQRNDVEQEGRVYLPLRAQNLANLPKIKKLGAEDEP